MAGSSAGLMGGEALFEIVGVAHVVGAVGAAEDVDEVGHVCVSEWSENPNWRDAPSTCSLFEPSTCSCRRVLRTPFEAGKP